MSLQKWKDILGKYQYISFDLFDTLSFRAVDKPDDVFELVGIRYDRLSGKKFQSFRRLRIEAEKRARKKVNWEEVDIDLIYDELQRIAGISSEQRKQLVDLEKNIEVVVSVCNQTMKELYDWCKAEKKTICITTDMYLDRKTIDRILRKHGIFPEYIFISGEENKTKENGKLFDVVLDKLKINAAQLVHIGDNRNSDVIIPNAKGICALERTGLPDKIHQYSHITRGMETEAFFLDAFLKKSAQRISNVPEWRIGYSVIGPILFELCRWIHETKEKKKLEKLCFIAREGYLIKRAYEMLYPDELNDCIYLCLNKNLLRLPFFTVNAFKEVLKASFDSNEERTWENVFTIIKVPGVEKLLDVIKKFGYKKNDFIKKSGIEKGEYDAVFEALESELAAMAQDQKKFLFLYLEQNDLIGKKIGLINNSVKGNAQFLLESILESSAIKIDCVGMQISKDQIHSKRLGDRVVAWFDDINLSKLQAYLFERNSLVFEHLLFAQEGTALLFEKISDVIFIKKEKQGCEERNNRIIDSIQSLALKFVWEYSKADCDVMPKAAIAGFIDLSSYPFKEDAGLLSNLYDQDDSVGGRKINNVDLSFKPSFLWSNSIYRDISWMQGYLASTKESSILVKIFNARLRLTSLLK